MDKKSCDDDPESVTMKAEGLDPLLEDILTIVNQGRQRGEQVVLLMSIRIDGVVSSRKRMSKLPTDERAMDAGFRRI